MPEMRPYDLSYYDALTLHSSLRQKRRGQERSKAKSTFVPEPGRRDVAADSIARLLGMEDRLMEFIKTFPNYDPDEWDDDPQ